MRKKNSSKTPNERTFKRGDSQFCQCCGKISFVLYDTVQGGSAINQLKYCKKCFDEKKK